METTTTTPNVVLPPKFSETDPEVAAAQKLAYDLKFIQDLRTELKDWRNTNNSVVLLRANQDHWWKRYANGNLLEIDMPKVNSLEEVEAYADQGIPTWLMESDGKCTFGPRALFQVVQDAVEFQRRETTLTIEAEEAKANSRLKSVTDMLKTPEIDWMVEGKIHAKGLCQIFGESYAGKTLLVLDLVMSWCAGLPVWQGYKLNNDGEPQDAVYVAAEGGAALSVHVDAWLKHHPEVKPGDLSGLLFLDGGEGDHMFLSIGKTEVDATESWTRLKQEVIAANIAPTVMVFDTQIDLAPGIEENSNTDMVGVLRKVKSLGDQLGFVAIVVHHTGHDGNKARGASGMMAKCDTQAKLTVIGNKPGKAKLQWMKVKGMALPEDSISYAIQGHKQLQELDSLGAVCVPIGKLEAAITEHQTAAPTDDLQRDIMNAINTGHTSARQISDAIGVNKDSVKLKEALVWMQDANMLERTGKGPKTAYVLSALAVAPSEY